MTAACEVCGATKHLTTVTYLGQGTFDICLRCKSAWMSAAEMSWSTWIAAERAELATAPAPEWTDGLTALAGISRGETWEGRDEQGISWGPRVVDLQACSASSFVDPTLRWRRVSEHEHSWTKEANGHVRTCACGARQVAKWEDAK